MAGKLDQLEKIEVTDREQWRKWLEKNHERNEGVWLITWKKATPAKHVTYEEMVEEALCFGWIDSVPRKLDEQRRMLYFCPRRSRSVWSTLNKERVAKLIANGSMTSAGLAKIEEAKRNGSWNAFDAVDADKMPDDLVKALSKNKKAKVHFEQFPPGSKRIISYWIGSARTAGTREKRIKETVELAAKNIRANQARK